MQGIAVDGDNGAYCEKGHERESVLAVFMLSCGQAKSLDFVCSALAPVL